VELRESSEHFLLAIHAQDGLWSAELLRLLKQACSMASTNDIAVVAIESPLTSIVVEPHLAHERLESDWAQPEVTAV